MTTIQGLHHGLGLRGRILVLGCLLAVGCGPGAESDAPAEADASDTASTLGGDVQAVSLMGFELRRSELDSSSWPLQDSLLAEARAELEANPDDPDALVWVGRRLGYLGRYDEAIAVFTEGIERYPLDARFLRHRGHRLITTRRLDDAIADLAQAWRMVEGTEDQVEPDGLPNARGVPTSTLHSNIRYHLGLAHYLQGDFEAAYWPFRADFEAAVNPDMLVASSYWLYMILGRLGRWDEAIVVMDTITEDMDIIENDAYHDLLLLHADVLKEADLLGEEGEASLQGTTTAYGLAIWYFFQGRSEDAQKTLIAIVEGTSQWPAFGYIAAEAELSRTQ